MTGIRHVPFPGQFSARYIATRRRGKVPVRVEGLAENVAPLKFAAAEAR
jgi:hypothetical protein